MQGPQMVWWVEAPAVKTASLRLIPETHNHECSSDLHSQKNWNTPCSPCALRASMPLAFLAQIPLITKAHCCQPLRGQVLLNPHGDRCSPLQGTGSCLMSPRW